MIKNYLLIALRSLMKNKLFIFINVFGMGIAIACCIVAYLNWNFSNAYDTNHVNAKSIYRVQFYREFQGRSDRYGMAPMPLGQAIRQNIKDVDKVVRYMPAGANIRIGDHLFNTQIGYVDSAFFDMFTYEMKHGLASDLHDRGKIFISDELAKKYFNREEIVGEPLTQIINGKPREFIVGGVFKKQPLNSSFYTQAFTLWDNYWATTTDPEMYETNWKRWNTLFLKIDDPSRIPVITKQLEAYIAPQNKVREDFKIRNYYLENFEGMALRGRDDPRTQGDWLNGGLPKEAVTVPAIMAILLLLLACFNFTNTSIAVSSRRLKEIGIRKVMGGLRKQLIIQFLGENLMLCFFGLVVGLLLAEILVPAYDSMWNWLDLSYTYSENAGFFVFLILLLLLTAIIAGSYPAFYITSFEPINILKGKMKFGGTNWFTRILLCGQFIISLLAIIMGVGFYGNAQYQKNYDLGFMTHGVISTFVKDEGEFNTYRDALASNIDIKVIAGTKHHIATSYYNDPIKWESLEKEVDIMDIGDNYLEALDMKLVAGRGFRKDSETDRKESVLVTEEFVKQFGWKDDAIGKRVVWMDTVQLYVIGVVKNVYASALWAPIEPMMLRYTSPDKYQQLVVSADPTKIPEVNEFMEKKWKEVFPNSVYDGQLIDRVLQETNEINTNVVKMFAFLGFFAALMSAVGLYTLVSLNILKKMKEIGVRKVMGASLANIAGVINIEFAIILSFASVAGGALGYFAADSLIDSIWEYYLKMNYLILGSSVLAMFIMAMLTVGFKTFSTASLNPTKTLRDE
jgi:putative ABC transport system permease protein